MAHAQSELVGKNWYIQNNGRMTLNGGHFYMSASNGATLTLAESPSPYEIFTILEGSEGKVKLYNKAANKYVGPVPQELKVAFSLVDENEAADFTAKQSTEGLWTLTGSLEGNTDGYTSLCATSEEKITRWGGGANSPYSKWIFTECSSEPNEFVTELSQIEPGRYYQIISTAVGVANPYISSETILANTDGVVEAEPADRRTVKRTTGSMVVPTLWQFEGNATDGYLIRNANTGLCLGQITNDALQMLAFGIDERWAGHYTPTFSHSLNAWSFQCEGEFWLNALEGTDDTTLGKPANNNADDTRNYWRILPITEVTVKVDFNKQLASLTLPFAVQLPEGLTAYYASKAEGTTLTLTPTGNQLLPARTPVFIAPDEPITTDTPYTLPIVYDTDAPAIDGNLFEGTTVARIGFGYREIFGLGTDGTKGTLIYNGNVAEFPCNKAFIRVSKFGATATPTHVTLQIGSGQSTGIEGVQTLTPATQQTDEYYDLSGRRVLRPAHGVYITKNGQKVFIH